MPTSTQTELDLRVRTWGGARVGAGRPRLTTGRITHATRPEHKARHPVHVTLRVCPDVQRLRQPKIFVALNDVLLRTGNTPSYRIVHLSVQGNHLHQLVEAADKNALARGTQRFQIQAARAINAAFQRRGDVFDDRYHRVDINTPKQARHALGYVLNNWLRHGEHERTPAAANALVDPYSTGCSFDGWADLADQPDYRGFASVEPHTWLLRVGWRRYGLIRVREIPGRLG